MHPLVWVLLAALAGLFLGLQTTAIGPRYSKLVIGLVFLIVLFRFPPHVGAGILLVLYAFPARIWIGNTNFIFTAFITIAWLVRVALRQEPRPHGSYLDWIILSYIAVHILSLANLRTQFALEKSLLALRHMTVPILFYYVLVNLGRSEKRLLFFAEMFTISVVFVFLSAFAQRFFPDVRFLPKWLLTSLGSQDLFFAREVGHGRVGGLFTHVMLGDTTAIACVLQVYLAIRYKARPLLRLYHWLLVLVCLYVVSLTQNRGSLLLMMAGSVYFLFLFSGELNWRRALVGLGVFVGLLYVGEVTLTRFEGDVTLLARLSGTYFERGIPDTRVGVWRQVWDLVMEKPILGHGPYYSLRVGALGRHVYWPHSAYLYYWFTTGVVGLVVFLVLIARVLKRTWAGRGLTVGGVSLSRGLTAVFHIAVLQFILGQLRSDHQRGDVFVFLMWIIFAFGVMARQLWEEEKRSGKIPVPQSRFARGGVPAALPTRSVQATPRFPG
jgi:O-antigen ligase